MDPSKRILGLDILRSMAILFVVLAHGLVALYPSLPYAGYLGHLGSVGVELFFVLSGYLIGGILLRYGAALAQPRAVLNFMARRWYRTLPNYFLFLLINALVALYIYNDFAGIRGDIWKYLLFLQNFSARIPSFFMESWSLAVEEWFYLLTPIALMIAMRATKGAKYAFPIVAGFFLLAPIALRVFSLDEAKDWNMDFRMVVIYRLDALMFGVMAAYLHKTSPETWRKLRWPGFIIGLVLVATAYVSMYRIELPSSTYAKLFLMDQFCLGFALVLPYFSSIKQFGKSLPNRAIRSIALWSYAMYLCNLLAQRYMMKTMETFYSASFLNGAITLLGYLAIVFIASACVYTFFEKPILAYRDRRVRELQASR